MEELQRSWPGEESKLSLRVVKARRLTKGRIVCTGTVRRRPSVEGFYF